MVTELWKNKLWNMRHGRWQTHGHIVTKTDGVSALTDSHFPILTSSMQAIRKDRRQKLCGTRQSQENQNVSVWVTVKSRISEGIHQKRVLFFRGVSMCFQSWCIIFTCWHRTCTKEINELTYWHELFSILAPNSSCYPLCIQENINHEHGWKSMR